MIAITERQQMVLDFITRFTQTHGYSPTVRDIAAHLGVSSPSGVNRHLEALEKKGWLKKTGASRGIVLTSHGGQSIPLKEEQMMEVRRSDREITPQESIDILDTAEYGILSTVGNDGQPYGVPLSYVHKGSIYFHCAISGHKLENIEHNAKVSFCVVGKTKVLPDKFGTEYESAVVFGRVSEVNGAERHPLCCGCWRNTVQTLSKRANATLSKKTRLPRSSKSKSPGLAVKLEDSSRKA